MDEPDVIANRCHAIASALENRSQITSDDVTWMLTTIREAASDLSYAIPRLVAAEQVCLVYGWTRSTRDTVNEKAMYQLWTEWFAILGEGGQEFLKESSHPELSDEYRHHLAARSDSMPSAALARLAAAGKLVIPDHGQS